MKQMLSGKSSLILWLLDRKEFWLEYPEKKNRAKDILSSFQLFEQVSPSFLLCISIGLMSIILKGYYPMESIITVSS